MKLPQQLRDRVGADDIPQQCYALVGAGLQVRGHARAAASRLQGQAQAAVRARDRLVTTGLQVGQETGQRIMAMPGDAANAVEAAWQRLRPAPRTVPSAVAEQVVDLRDGAVQQYRQWSLDGERAVAQWHAQRLLNERADRMTRSVTPFAARATVSARDAARTAAASPTAARLTEAGRRARLSARKAWLDYQATVAETGAQGWGDAAVNSAAMARNGGSASSPQR